MCGASGRAGALARLAKARARLARSPTWNNRLRTVASPTLLRAGAPALPVLRHAFIGNAPISHTRSHQLIIKCATPLFLCRPRKLGGNMSAETYGPGLLVETERDKGVRLGRSIRRKTPLIFSLFLSLFRHTPFSITPPYSIALGSPIL